MHGTADPVVPYDGGDTRLLGLFTRGAVRSARETAEAYAAGVAAAASVVRSAASARAEPASARITLSEVGLAAATVVRDGGVERMEWVTGRGTDRRAVRLVTQIGTGHVVPNLVTSPSPRFIGPSHHDLDTGSEIESFFSLDEASAAPSTRTDPAAE
jgi:polyhydroxybutyrate depolymerase